MRRHLPFLLLGALLVALSFGAKASSAHNYGDCAWSEQGQQLKFPDGTYKCVCVRQLGPQGKYDVWCSWRFVSPSAVRKPSVHAWHAPIKSVISRKPVTYALPKVVA